MLCLLNCVCLVAYTFKCISLYLSECVSIDGLEREIVHLACCSVVVELLLFHGFLFLYPLRKQAAYLH